MSRLELVILGTGGGATTVYHQQPSSSFVLLLDGQPLLLADCGFGVVSSCLTHIGALPDSVYISHNHSDHSGELNVMLAVESGRGRRMRVLSHPEVQQRLQVHRMHELQSTGKQLDEFALWQPCPASQEVSLTPDLTLRVVRSRHAELCYGAVLNWQGKPVLGWSADSGQDESLYQELSQAQCLLLDARSQGTPEHASFEQVAELARQLTPLGKQVYITGYGCQSERPAQDMDLGGATVVQPGQRIVLVQNEQPRMNECILIKETV